MAEKRDLYIIIPAVFLLTIAVIMGLRSRVDEHSPMVEACRKALSSTDYTHYDCPGGATFDMTPRYLRTQFSSAETARVYFYDGVNDMWCEMRRPGSDWVVTGTASTMAWPCP